MTMEFQKPDAKPLATSPRCWCLRGLAVILTADGYMCSHCWNERERMKQVA